MKNKVAYVKIAIADYQKALEELVGSAEAVAILAENALQADPNNNLAQSTLELVDRLDEFHDWIFNQQMAETVTDFDIVPEEDAAPTEVTDEMLVAHASTRLVRVISMLNVQEKKSA